MSEMVLMQKTSGRIGRLAGRYGENFSVYAAVTAIMPGYRFSTLARFREALDALVEGMKRGRKGGGADPLSTRK
jgi:hypothetical protein